MREVAADVQVERPFCFTSEYSRCRCLCTKSIIHIVRYYLGDFLCVNGSACFMAKLRDRLCDAMPYNNAMCPNCGAAVERGVKGGTDGKVIVHFGVSCIMQP